MPFNSATKNAIPPAIRRLCLQAHLDGLPDAIIHAAHHAGLVLAERAGDDRYWPGVFTCINLVAPSLKFIAKTCEIQAGGAPEMTDPQDRRAGALAIAIAETTSPWLNPEAA